jgi:hypothetical protein
MQHSLRQSGIFVYVSTTCRAISTREALVLTTALFLLQVAALRSLAMVNDVLTMRGGLQVCM